MKLLITAFAVALLSSCASRYPSSPISAPSFGSQTRQIQRSGSMTMKSHSLKTSSEKSIALVTQHKALITSSKLTEDNFNAIIRVPAHNLPSLMNSLGTNGKVTSKQVKISDITVAYLDLQAALKNKQALRDRLRSLLSSASKVEDTLKVEKELSRVQTELDQMRARMNSMQSKVSHSTLDLTIRRARIPGPLGVVKDGTSWALGKLLYLN